MAVAGRLPPITSSQADSQGAGGPLIVDAMNVIGTRPDGWWRDRDGAVRALAERLQRYARTRHVDAWLVVDGRPIPGLEEGTVGALEVRYALRGGPDAADDRIVRLVEMFEDPWTASVVTADRDLRRRVTELGASVQGPRQLLGALDALDPLDALGQTEADGEN